MAITYCDHCNQQIDLDYNCDHFTSNGDCVEQIVEQLEEEGLTPKQIEDYLDNL